MKVQALEMQEGMHHKPARDHEIMFQEFLDNMALMASPESAAGIVSSAGLLDDEFRSVLAKLQYREDDLPKTLNEALADPRAVVVTSMTSPFDIVDVNEAWVGLCGYDRKGAMHQNLGKLLQGPDTNAEDAHIMISKLRREHYADTMLTNYTKQGRKFQNHVQAGLLSDDAGQVKYFVGVLEEMFEDEETNQIRM
jgi:PAS domain S-box-containing protein